jgi:hypothetical protein
MLIQFGKNNSCATATDACSIIGGTCMICKDILEMEKKIEWWKPNLDTSIINYVGFYNESTKNKIVKTSNHWNGRLILQTQKNKVFIELDLFNEL